MQTKTKTNFLGDLAVGEAAERRVANYFNNDSDCYYCKASAKTQSYDFFCIMHGELIEVKNDRKAEQTGNIVFERNLFKTMKPMSVVYVIGDDGYVFEKYELWKALLALKKQGKTRFVMGGDRNANPIIIVKLADILPAAKKINLEGY